MANIKSTRTFFSFVYPRLVALNTTLIAAVLACACSGNPAAPTTPTQAVTTAPIVTPPAVDPRVLHGTVTTLTINNKTAYVVTPDPGVGAPNAVRPWIWFMPATYFTSGPIAGQGADYVNAWLDAGFYIGAIEAGPTCGSPAGTALFEAFYQKMTTSYPVASRARIFASSRGGLDAYAFAERHPDQVDRIGGIYPAVDWRDWPGLDGLPGYTVDVLGFTPTELANQDALNPINNLKPMAEARIPLFDLHGDQDETVHLAPNSQEVAKRYAALGGSITLVVLPGRGHEAYGFFRQDMIDFLLAGSISARR